MSSTFNNCPRGSCVHLAVSCPRPTVMPNGAVGRTGSLESAPPLLARSWDPLSFPPVKWPECRKALGTEARGLPSTPPPQAPFCFHPPRPEWKETAGGSLLPGCGRFQIGFGRALRLEARAASCTRRPPAGDRGAGVPPARKPGPWLPLPHPPAAHKYSLGPGSGA